MKKQFVYRSLLLVTILFPTFSYTKIEGDFESIAFKPYPGEKHFGMVKTAEEIPQFKNITPEQKTAWNQLASQINAKTKSDVEKSKSLKPLQDQVSKLEDNYYAKETQLNQEIEKILQDNPEFKKLRAEIDALKKQLESLDKEIESLNSKRYPLIKQQGELIASAYEKEYVSASAASIMNMTPQERAVFIDKVEKTKEYQDLEKQLAPLTAQRDQIQKKITPIFEQMSSLGDQLNKIKNDAKKAKDFPANLKKLNAEVEQLEKQRDALRKQLRELEQKSGLGTSEIYDKITQLEQLFINIKKESK